LIVRTGILLHLGSIELGAIAPFLLSYAASGVAVIAGISVCAIAAFLMSRSVFARQLYGEPPTT
jgi:hypothetical protein